MKNGITCPLCGSETRVRKTLQQRGRIKRKRVCVACDYRVTTYETRPTGTVPRKPGVTYIPIPNASIRDFLKDIEQQSIAVSMADHVRKLDSDDSVS